MYKLYPEEEQWNLDLFILFFFLSTIFLVCLSYFIPFSQEVAKLYLFYFYFRWDSEDNSAITDQMLMDVDNGLAGKYSRDIILGKL